jgi:ABC-type antimicrobial peptide transport system permease subunit
MTSKARSPIPRKAALLILMVEMVVALGLPVAVIAGLATGGVHRAIVVFVGYMCGFSVLFLPLHWMSAFSGWRSSQKLWRERMASGFYKTLPPVKDDDDD